MITWHANHESSCTQINEHDAAKSLYIRWLEPEVVLPAMLGTLGSAARLSGPSRSLCATLADGDVLQHHAADCGSNATVLLERVAKVNGPRIESDSRGEVVGCTVGAVATDPTFEVYLAVIAAVSGARPQSCVVIERHQLRRRPHRLFTSCGQRSMSRAIG